MEQTPKKSSVKYVLTCKLLHISLCCDIATVFVSDVCRLKHHFISWVQRKLGGFSIYRLLKLDRYTKGWPQVE